MVTTNSSNTGGQQTLFKGQPLGVSKVFGIRLGWVGLGWVRLGLGLG